MALLEVKDLDKTFIAGDRPISAIDKLTLSVEENEFVSIVGPSGCGKSTFLHIIGGFEPASGGAVRLNGRPIGRPGPDRGMMFQELSLFPWLTALANVCWPLEMKGMPKAQRLAKAQEYLDVVHLSRYADFYPTELSGGMKQRVALARTLACDPTILLLDEPFGALDAQTREVMQDEMLRIWLQTRKTVLMVTHDVTEAVFLSNRICVMSARPGRIVEEFAVTLDRSVGREQLMLSDAFNTLRNEVWLSVRRQAVAVARESAA